MNASAKRKSLSAVTFDACLSIAALLFVFAACEKKPVTGWGTFRNDNSLSALSSERLDLPLGLDWVYEPMHAPRTAWYEPSEEMPRSHFDNAHYVSAAGGTVYFGSTVDGKVYALDSSDGGERWSFYTDGPVRCQPTLFDNRVYFGSDDGFVYCLSASNGKEIWKYRAFPDDRKLLGNERMISPAPVRTNILIRDGIAYFAAGVFSYEGIYICALDAGTGSVLWMNDTIGDRAHELDYNGICPQGYLLATDDKLYVPNGRALPAVFDIRTGEFLYQIRPSGKKGGTWAMINGDKILAGIDFSGEPHKDSFALDNGRYLADVYSLFPIVDIVITQNMSVLVTREGLIALDNQKIGIMDDNGRKQNELYNDMLEVWNSLDKDQQTRLTKAQSEQSREDRDAGAPLGVNDEYDRLFAVYAALQQEKRELTKAVRTDEYPLWQYRRGGLESVMAAGNMVIAGGDGFVAAFSVDSGAIEWEMNVEGKAVGLAVNEGRLYVSSDNGNIYCFGKKGGAEKTGPDKDETLLAGDSGSRDAGAVDAVLSESGIDRGYCLLVNAGSGGMAMELAKKTGMQIIAVDENSRIVERSRELFDKAGLLGARISISDWRLDQMPDYFANLIIYNGRLSENSRAAELFRILKPCGGMLFTGSADAKSESAMNEIAALIRMQPYRDISVISSGGMWVKAERGSLPGAGSWTHAYANPENTACSDDTLVRGSLGILWFGAPGPEGLIDRHARSMSPVAMDGRFFVEGEETIRAYDSYNGLPLWKRKIPGAVRVQINQDGGNLALAGDGLYVAANHKCIHLDPESGEVIREFDIPHTADGAQRRWGFIAREGDILYGSAAVPLKAHFGSVWDALCENGVWRVKENVPEVYHGYYDTYTSRYPKPDINARRAFKREAMNWLPMTDWPAGGEFYLAGARSENMLISDMIFAIDVTTGETLWTREGRRIANITISLGGGKLFYADAGITPGEKNRAVEQKRALARNAVYEEGDDWNEHFLGKRGYEMSYEDLDVRRVVALDAARGETVWETVVDLTGCAGDAMGTAYRDNVLMFFGNYGNHDAWRHSGDQLKFRRVTALDASTGKMSWSRPLNYRTRPLLINDTLVLEPRACDFRTGELITRTHPVTGEEVPWEFIRPGHCCSISSACPNMLFTRSYTGLLYDMEHDRGVTLFGGVRASCFINMIPANGLLIYPEGGSGCTCSFPVKCSMALKPLDTPPDEWAVFVTPGALTPVKNLAVNLGAPADMKAVDGTLWFGYPNPETRYLGNHYPDYGVKFDLHESIDGDGYYASDFRGKHIEGTDTPWLFTSGCEGLSHLEIPVLDPEKDGPAEYTVIMGFMARAGDRPGERVFDISIQGRTVLGEFDLFKYNGSSTRPVVREFSDIEATDSIRIDFSSRENSDAPLVNFIKLVRSDPRVSDASVH